VAWAAAAALKNMALEKSARAVIEADSSFECYCRFKDSHDWLEGAPLLCFILLRVGSGLDFWQS